MSVWQSIKDGIKSGVKKGTTAILGFLGATTAAELVFYCAFKGAILGSGLGSLFPISGNIAGLVIGGLLGAGLAGALLFLAYKGLTGLDKSLGKDSKSNFELNENPNESLEKINKIKQLKFVPFRTLLNNITADFYQINLIANRSSEVKRLGVAELNDNFEEKYAPLISRTMPDQFRPILPVPTRAAPKNRPDHVTINIKETTIPSENAQQNNDNNGFFGFIKKVYNVIRTPFTKFKTLFKIAGGAAAIGSIVSCAYYGAMIGGTVGHAIPIPVIGPIIGYISGGLLGAVISGVMVFFVGKSIIKIDSVLTDKKQPEKPTLKSQLTKMRNSLNVTQQHFVILKGNALRLVSISKSLINASKYNNRPTETIHKLDITRSTKNDGEELIFERDKTTIKTTQNNVKSSSKNKSLPSSNDNDQASGFFATIKRFYNYVKKPTLLLVGVPASAVTILSCAYYGALLGSAIGTTVPGLGNLAGLIIGGICGAAVAGAAIYLTATGLIEFNKFITGQDEHSLLMKDLENTLNELREFNNEIQQLNGNLETNKRLHCGLPEIPVQDNDQHSFEVSKNESIPSNKQLHQSDKQPLIESQINDDHSAEQKGFFSTIKDNFVAFIGKISTPVLAFFGGTAGLITVGTCAYYGAMIGGSVGTVFPGPGNIIGMVAGGILGAMIGFCFVTLTAKMGIAVHEKMTHNKADAVNNKLNEINQEYLKFNQNVETLQHNLREMNDIWGDTFNARNKEEYQDRLGESQKLGSNNYERKYGDSKQKAQAKEKQSVSFPKSTPSADQQLTSTIPSASYTSSSTLLRPPRPMPPKPKGPPPQPPTNDGNNTHQRRNSFE